MVDASNLVNMEIGTKPNPKLGVTNRTKLYQSTPSTKHVVVSRKGKCSGTNFFFHFCNVANGATSKV
jgi:hypothetical protein